jgi:uncharacterized membrane protein
MVARTKASNDDTLERSIFDKTNLTNFSDAVIAIAITLLVLQLKLPYISDVNINAMLLPTLSSNLGEIIGYVIGFWVIASYWFRYHIFMKYVKVIDSTYVMLNVIFILFIGFLPFPTSILIQYPAHVSPVIFYGINILMLSIIQILMWVYASRNGRLTGDIDTVLADQITMGRVVGTVIFLLSILVAFVSPVASMVMWFLPSLIAGPISRRIIKTDISKPSSS